MNEIMDEYERIHNMIFRNHKDKNTELVKTTMNDMFLHMYKKDPVYASKILGKLLSIEWKQYLTKEEANEIYNKLNPQGRWRYDVFIEHMKECHLPIEAQGLFNSYALWITINSLYSDHAQSIAKIVNIPVSEIPNTDFICHMYKLAIDKLSVENGYFDIRKYFDL